MWEPGLALERKDFLLLWGCRKRCRRRTAEKWWSRKARSRGSPHRMGLTCWSLRFCSIIYSTPSIRHAAWKNKSIKFTFCPATPGLIVWLETTWKWRQEKEDIASPSQGCVIMEFRETGVFEKEFAVPHPRLFLCKAHLYRLHYILYMLLNPEKPHPLLNFSSLLVSWDLAFRKKAMLLLLSSHYRPE